MAEDWQQGGFGLYIHWPFCEAKCPYCDFNSHVVRRIDQRAWRNAYLSELRRAAAETPGRILTSVFFGGGTPSLMDPETVADVIAELRQLWPVANDLEITLEANPGSVEAGRFAAYRQGGVNRISMGVQALNDADLRRLAERAPPAWYIVGIVVVVGVILGGLVLFLRSQSPVSKPSKTIWFPVNSGSPMRTAVFPPMESTSWSSPVVKDQR